MVGPQLLLLRAASVKAWRASLSLSAGFLDWVPKKMQRVGCMELLNTVQRRVQPKLHVFGHIHEGKRVCLQKASASTQCCLQHCNVIIHFKCRGTFWIHFYTEDKVYSIFKHVKVILRAEHWYLSLISDNHWECIYFEFLYIHTVEGGSVPFEFLSIICMFSHALISHSLWMVYSLCKEHALPFYTCSVMHKHM